MATCKNFRELTVSERRKLVRKKDICPKCLKSMQRIKHKEVSECKWKNCDNCQQAHHALLCDKPRGSQAVMKASYETHDGDDQDNADEDDDSYFTMKDRDHFIPLGKMRVTKIKVVQTEMVIYMMGLQKNWKMDSILGRNLDYVMKRPQSKLIQIS